MKIAVLGTGVVGQAHAAKLAELGHDVTIGTNNVDKTMAKKEPDAMGRPPYPEWIKEHKNIWTSTFKGAVKDSDIVLCALNGNGALTVLTDLKNDLIGKVLIDITNPLDFSKGYLTLFVVNDDSLGEQIQKTLPETYVVKAFSTMNANVQVDPSSVADGDHHLFIAGNDKKAKEKVVKFATEEYGWKNILDLGGIESSRGIEMILPIWLQIMGAEKTATFNFKIQK